MYEARFTTKQVYDNYSKSLGKPKSKPAMSRSLGGFEPDPAQRTSTKKVHLPYKLEIEEETEEAVRMTKYHRF